MAWLHAGSSRLIHPDFIQRMRWDRARTSFEVLSGAMWMDSAIANAKQPFTGDDAIIADSYKKKI